MFIYLYSELKLVTDLRKANVQAKMNQGREIGSDPPTVVTSITRLPEYFVGVFFSMLHGGNMRTIA